MRMMRFFWWIFIPVGVYLAYQTMKFSAGLPHFIWSYSWVDEGQGYDPWAERYYTRCTFIGPYGSFTTTPNIGKCGWIIFRKNHLDGGGHG